MPSGMENLEWRLNELEHKYGNTISTQESKIKNLEAQVNELRNKQDELQKEAKQLKESGGGGAADIFVKRAEWKITDLKKKKQQHPRGESIWSPEFNASGVKSMQLEFFPNGRESTSLEGFCSLFLWCPTSTKIRYQLWVGNHLRAPDEDEYDGRMGHGHSNFCNLDAEATEDGDEITVGVDMLEVKNAGEPEKEGLKLVKTSFTEVFDNEMLIEKNKDVNRVEWKIQNISKRLKSLPRGTSLFSQLITVGGVKDILLEFYPNGSQNTTKDGFCAYYIRGPKGVSVTITLFVGGFKKGPIQTSFDGATGKGLPDFCEVEKEIDKATDSLIVGIDVKNNTDPKQAGAVLKIPAEEN